MREIVHFFFDFFLICNAFVTRTVLYCVVKQHIRLDGGDFMEELAKEMREELLLEEAKRCLKCKVAKCKKACPISTDIPTIMNLFLE